MQEWGGAAVMSPPAPAACRWAGQGEQRMVGCPGVNAGCSPAAPPSRAGPGSPSSAVSGDDARWQCDDGVPAALEAAPSAHGLASCWLSPPGPELWLEVLAVLGGTGDPPARPRRGKGRWGPSGEDQDPARERAEAFQALLLVLPEINMLPERDVPQPAIAPRRIHPHPIALCWPHWCAGGSGPGQGQVLGWISPRRVREWGSHAKSPHARSVLGSAQ